MHDSIEFGVVDVTDLLLERGAEVDMSPDDAELQQKDYASMVAVLRQAGTVL